MMTIKLAKNLTKKEAMLRVKDKMPKGMMMKDVSYDPATGICKIGK